MKILYPDKIETQERGIASLFVDSRTEDMNTNQVLLPIDILMRKPFCYWIGASNELVYFGPHWRDGDYNDYFWSDNITNFFNIPHEIVFDDYDDLASYWSKFHFDIRPPAGLVVNMFLEAS
ncbi:hypothetical protein J4477_01630 [Candidatus Pacearchaeota archaeon]|nr:hypothetical protein [Candidatus Pacearchaeota archaeon]